jgi:hypothetical protein
MRSGPPRRNQLVSYAAWKRQIGKLRVQVSQLAAADAEFDSAEAMFGDADAFPGRDGPLDRVPTGGHLIQHI